MEFSLLSQMKGSVVKLEGMINRQHKDRLFKAIFGDEKRKENLLSLYNALNGTDHKDPDDLEITTIDDAIYMGMKNDVSCIIDNYMSLFEQQSTYNPNMAVREFLYCGRLYNQYIKEKELDIYGHKLINLPVPQCYVFYNGTEECPDREAVRLSDSFGNVKYEGIYEWTTVMLNINYGHNKELMEKCKPLSDYARLISRIRTYKKKKDIFEAVNQAVDECIRDGILTEYLIRHRAEVLDMCITEYDEKKHLENVKNTSWQEGRQEGRQEGEINMIIKLFKKGLLSLPVAARELSMSEEKFKMLL